MPDCPNGIAEDAWLVVEADPKSELLAADDPNSPYLEGCPDPKPVPKFTPAEVGAEAFDDLNKEFDAEPAELEVVVGFAGSLPRVLLAVY
jgi:hypothetical protein